MGIPGCTKLLDALEVVAGKLVVDKGFDKAHLERCSDCRRFWDRIEWANKQKVPNCVPKVMAKIKAMGGGKIKE